MDPDLRKEYTDDESLKRIGGRKIIDMSAKTEWQKNSRFFITSATIIMILSDALVALQCAYHPETLTVMLQNFRQKMLNADCSKINTNIAMLVALNEFLPQIPPCRPSINNKRVYQTIKSDYAFVTPSVRSSLMMMIVIQAGGQTTSKMQGH